jgi:hypothetical protein
VTLAMPPAPAESARDIVAGVHGVALDVDRSAGAPPAVGHAHFRDRHTNVLRVIGDVSRFAEAGLRAWGARDSSRRSRR